MYTYFKKYIQQVINLETYHHNRMFINVYYYKNIFINVKSCIENIAQKNIQLGNTTMIMQIKSKLDISFLGNKKTQKIF